MPILIFGKKKSKLLCDADLCLDIEDNKILYETEKNIYGMKLKHTNCLSSLSSGDLLINNFKIEQIGIVFWNYISNHGWLPWLFWI